MPRRPSNAPERLVDATAALLGQRGYHGTGIKAVALAARVPLGSLYFHFPGGKNDLVVAALDASASALDEILRRRLAEVRTGAEAVEAFTATFRDRLDRSAFLDGCPLATTALEVAGEIDLVAQVIDHGYRRWTDHLIERLDAAGLADAAALATLVVAAVEGALVLARARQSLEPYDLVAQQLGAVASGWPRRATPAG